MYEEKNCYSNNSKKLDIKEVLKCSDYDFLRTNQKLNKNIMFLTFGGSHAYGTNTEDSDIDLRGMFLPTKEDILFNFNEFEQFEDKKTDTVIYGLDKGISLLCKCNPNIIEMLGCREEDYAYISEAGKLLLKNKELFLSKLAIDTFSGYARKQLCRLKNALARDTMTLCEEHFFMIDIVERMYQHLEDTFPTFNKEFLQFYVTDKKGNKIKVKENIVKLEDLVFIYQGDVLTKLTLKENTVKKEKEYQLDLNDTELKVNINIQDMTVRDITGVYSEVSKVLKDFTTHIGHRNQKKDCKHLNKHAMHLTRLYLMAFDILEKHEINTYRKDDHELLLKIRNGYYMQEDGTYSQEFYNMIDGFEEKLHLLEKTTTLPNKPDMVKIQNLVIEIKSKILGIDNDYSN